MMNFLKNSKLTLLLLGAVFISSICGAEVMLQDVNKEQQQIRQFILANGHDPSLSPEQARKFVKEGGTNAKNPYQAVEESAATKKNHYTTGGSMNLRKVSDEELIAHVNKHGHNPDMSPEQIYKRIREESP
jgi:hypothetical protein